MNSRQDLTRVETPAPLMPMPRRARKAVLVLGMSRSGTSLLAHVLHVLGAALPHDLIGAGHGNPLGHFEPRALVDLNDCILESLGRRWDDPRPIPARWFRSRPAYQFMERIIDQIRSSYDDAPLLLIKDPRLCRLLPLYLDALDVLDIEPLVMLQMRPVAEVVQSLIDRDDMQPALAEFLWLRSVIEAEWHSRNCQRVWVSMAELIADWRGAVCRIADALRLEWPVDPDAAAGEIGVLLKPRPHHRVAPVADEDQLRRFSAAVWTAAERGLSGDEPAARTAFDLLRGMLLDIDRVYEPYLVELAAMQTSLLELAAMQTSLSWRLTAPLRALRRVIRFR